MIAQFASVASVISARRPVQEAAPRLLTLIGGEAAHGQRVPWEQHRSRTGLPPWRGLTDGRSF